MIKKDARTVAIMDTLMENPYPMSLAQIAEATSIPYPTLSRRVNVMVAEGSLAIDKIAGPNGRTAFYKLSGVTPTIKWMKGGIAIPEDVSLAQAYDMAKNSPAVGAIDQAIANLLIRLVDGAVTETISSEDLQDLRSELDNLMTMLTDRVIVITSIQASPMWSMRAINVIKGGLSI